MAKLTVSHEAQRRAQKQFGRQAALYAVSQALRGGESLDILSTWAAFARAHIAVDVATGAGFTAFALAPFSDHVIATDITPEMVAQARVLAAERNLGNVSGLVAQAEALPFGDGSLDVVACRLAAHHFGDPAASVRHWARTLRPGGVLLFCDTCTPEDDDMAAWMNDAEARRDPSHVRDWKASEWSALFGREGMEITHTATAPVALEIDDWTARSNTPHDVVTSLRRDFLSASPAIKAEFGIVARADGRIEFHWTAWAARAVRRSQ